MVDDDYSAGRGGNLFPFSRLSLRLHYVPKLVIIIYIVILLLRTDWQIAAWGSVKSAWSTEYGVQSIAGLIARLGVISDRHLREIKKCEYTEWDSRRSMRPFWGLLLRCTGRGADNLGLTSLPMFHTMCFNFATIVQCASLGWRLYIDDPLNDFRAHRGSLPPAAVHCQKLMATYAIIRGCALLST